MTVLLCFNRRHLVSLIIATLLLAVLFSSASGSTRVPMEGRPEGAYTQPAKTSAQVTLPDKTGTQWYPYLEWSLTNTSFSGDPFDLVATVTFTHTASGETRTTEMFYDPNDTWKFRFTGTRTGEWTFATASADLDLDGYAGTVTIDPNPQPDAHGFMKNFGNKWGWQGTETSFVPQLVMYRDPPEFYNQPALIDADIQRFLVEHGFNGFQVNVFTRWWNIDEPTYDNISAPQPDPRTFEAIELLLSKTLAAGGAVHLWMWGDEQRHMTPVKWGINGPEDQQLQRYIAARLGPIPGWSMGYGFDLNEWVSASQIQTWHGYMHSKMGPNHFLGGRPSGPNSGTDHSGFIGWNTPLDYSSYEHHRPSYDVYVAALQTIPGQPVLSEDRFRIRNQGRSKDYNMEDTRRGLWRSTMAGGVGNIWGNLLSGTKSISDPYPNPEWIKTYAVFFQDRFVKELVRDNSLRDGVALATPIGERYLFYSENASTIQMNLSTMSGSQPAVAVDAKKPYSEINLGLLSATDQTWNAPYVSDWAIAVGTFDGSSPPSDITPPSAVTGLVAIPISETQIDLSWQRSADPESGVALYKVYRDGTATGTAGVTTFSDLGLSPGTSYTYEVSALNGAGLEGVRSAPVIATTLADTTPPTIQGTLTQGPTRVNVLFSEPLDLASATDPTNYSISNGITISSAALASDLVTVILDTSDHSDGVTYTLTVNNVLDRASVPIPISPNTQVTYTFVEILTIAGLTVASGRTYEVVDGGLSVGANLYIDRAYTFSSLPASLEGMTYIKTANDDKSRTDPVMVSFLVNQDVTVYVAYDARATSLPNWLAGWSSIGVTLATTDFDTDRDLYGKELGAGQISLGGNVAAGASGAESNYSIIVSTGGLPVTLPGMNAPAQDLDGDGKAEDVNGNGLLDFADVVALFQHMDSPEVTGNLALFDFNNNGLIDAGDVVALFEQTIGA